MTVEYCDFFGNVLLVKRGHKSEAAIRPRVRSVHIQSLNHNTASREIPIQPIFKTAT